MKVIVGLSGGVDSAVALLLLKKQGIDVEAMFMRNWDSATNNDILGNPTANDDICPQEKDYQDALEVAEKIGVKLNRVDFVEEYWNTVFKYFLDEYKKNRTPNPDIMCNKEIKFKAFLKRAEELGAEYIAMGHYARVIHDGDKHYLLRAIDQNKDQTYFLAFISTSQLAKAIFPIGELTKKEVRKIAEENNLPVATKKDSTGVCFIGERNFREFLKNYLPATPGNILTMDGKVVGKHEGTMYYTIGQRHGLGIGGEGEPWYIVGKDLQNNVLYAAQGKTNPLLYANRIIVSNANFFNEPPLDGAHLTAKFRYRAKDEDVIIHYLDNNKILVETIKPSWAVTPGQACVFYDGYYCLGGAIIDQVFMNDEERHY